MDHRAAVSPDPRWETWIAAADVSNGAAPSHLRLTLVPRLHPLRSASEACIGEVYERAFGARQLAFPAALVALIDAADRLLCVAGLRTAADGFFSEIYLDEPIEQLLVRRFGVATPREALFEVTTLASPSVTASAFFMRRIAELGERVGFMWSFFTATERLRTLLSRIGITVVELEIAERSRITHPERWGSYYDHAPKVCAVSAGWVGCWRHAGIAP
jgi:Thermostable hemolysin